MADDRRRVVLVATIVLACAVVAAAARSDLADGTAAAFTLDRRANAVMGIALAAMVLLSILLIAWASWGTAKAKGTARRRTWRDAAALAVTVLLIAALISMNPPRQPEGREGDDGSSALGGAPPASQTVDESPAARASPTGSVAIALVALAALALTIAVTARARRRGAYDGGTGAGADGDSGQRPATTAAAAPDAIAEAIAAARSESDPRRSILLAYRGAELALRGGPLARPPSTAPREWLSSIRRRTGPDATVHRAMTTLTARYEIARFSTHAPSGDDRTAALDALESLAAVGTQA